MLNEILAAALADAYDQGFPEERLAELAAETVKACLPEMAKAVTGSLHRTKADLLVSRASDRNALERKITAEYGTAFGNFEAATHVAYELIADLHEEYVTCGAADRYSPTCQILFLLHGRACTVAAEILHLLRGGYADGANARHRTLHEIVVVMTLIADAKDEELAHRYLDYAVVERHLDMISYQENCDRLNQAPFTASEIAKAERQRDKVLKRRGEQFRKQNQWAAPLFPGSRQISFSMLERQAGMSHKRPFYLSANHHVHAGPRAAMMNLHHRGARAFIGVGARSGERVGETAHGTLIHLVQCTASVVVRLHKAVEPDFDRVLGLATLQLLVEHAGKSFSRASARI